MALCPGWIYRTCEPVTAAPTNLARRSESLGLQLDTAWQAVSCREQYRLYFRARGGVKHQRVRLGRRNRDKLDRSLVSFGDQQPVGQQLDTVVVPDFQSKSTGLEVGDDGLHAAIVDAVSSTGEVVTRIVEQDLTTEQRVRACCATIPTATQVAA
ncbi:hypothetical protein NKJ60_06095 [Mesorhizobium sp. M0085]